MPTRRTHSRTLLSVSAALLSAATAIALSGCGGSSSGASTGNTPSYADSITMQLDGPVTSLDPAKGASFQDAVVDWSMYDTLVNADSNGKIIPGLATKWTVTPSVATFTIRNDVTCSDGEKLTGNVVAASLNRFFAPATAAPFASSVMGAGNSAQVTASGQQVTVTLAKPFSGLLTGLTVGYTGIVCSAGVKTPSMLTTKSDGTGGYVATSEVSGSSYTFTRRDGYTWGPVFSGVPTKGERPKTLTMKVIEDENTRANLQTTGQLQISDYTTNDWQRVTKQSGWTKDVSQQSDTFLMFNHTAGHATADKNVRKAIAQAINKTQLNKVQSYGAGKLISNLGEPSYECYDDSLASDLPKYDAAAAGETLKGVKISVIGTTLLAGGDGNTYVQTALQSAGAQVTFKNMNNQQWVSDLFTPKNDWDVTILVFANTASNLLSGGNFFSGAIAPNGQNLSAVTNPSADAALQTARETTGAQSCAALTEFQKDLFDNVDVLPLSTAPANVVFAPGVTAMISKGFVRAGSIRVANGK